ncbi:ATP-dependent transcriptional regulator, MalT-like, LuxR family [Lachnospiraceae bacterium KM106-2]|nr:ATP-dependent transcriptional regulator, MalT-like, LuxR family [Lachnospiraceae bacterium KM106-2]
MIVPLTETYSKWKKYFKDYRYVYLCAMSGYGKTTSAQYFAKNYMKCWYYLSVEEADFIEKLNHILNQKMDGRVSPLIIIDDLQWLSSERWNQFISAIVSDNVVLHKFHFFLLSRAELPPNLKPYQLTGHLLEIDNTSMRFQRPQFEKLLELRGMGRTQKEVEFLEKNAHDYPVAAMIIVNRLKKYSIDELQKSNTLMKEFKFWVIQDIYIYFDQRLFNRWEEDIREFLIEIAGFEVFTVEMADYIRGRNDSETILHKIMKVGSFIKQVGNRIVIMNEDKENAKKLAAVSKADREAILRNEIPAANLEKEYSIFPFFRYYLVNRQVKELSKERWKLLYSRAGYWYEKKRRFLQAMDSYQTAGEKNKVKELIIQNDDLYGGVSGVEKIASYIDQMEKKDLLDSPEILAVAALLESIRLHKEISEAYLDRLEYLMESMDKDSTLYYKMRTKVIYLKLVFPHRETYNLLGNINKYGEICREYRVHLNNACITANIPSVINGVKDICTWCRHPDEICDCVREPMRYLLGERFTGAVDIGVGENYYYKNQINEAISNVIKGQSASLVKNNLILTFAANGCLARVFIAEGNIDTAQSIMTDLEKLVHTKKVYSLLANINTFKVRIAMYRDDIPTIHSWLIEDAPNEYGEIFITLSYQYMTKLRAYIRNNELTKAMILIEKIEELCLRCHRSFVWMKVMLLKSLVLYRQHEKWEAVFDTVIKKAASYHFIRVVADEGVCIYELFMLAKKKGRFHSFQDQKFLDELQAELEKMARYYPNYLKYKSKSNLYLSPIEMSVLQKIVEGKSNPIIADELNMTVHGIKYHVTNIYRKMKVRNRAEAIAIAKEKKIV